MKLLTVIVALVLLSDLALARSPVRQRLGPWRPTLTAEADTANVTPGQTITVQTCVEE